MHTHNRIRSRRKIVNVNARFWITEPIENDVVVLDAAIQIVFYGTGPALLAIDAEGLFICTTLDEGHWGESMYVHCHLAVEKAYGIESRDWAAKR